MLIKASVLKLEGLCQFCTIFIQFKKAFNLTNLFLCYGKCDGKSNTQSIGFLKDQTKWLIQKYLLALYKQQLIFHQRALCEDCSSSCIFLNAMLTVDIPVAGKWL